MNTAIQQTKENPQLILTLPFETMIKFICGVGTKDKSLYQDLIEIAGDKYGIDYIRFHLIKQLDEYNKKSNSLVETKD